MDYKIAGELARVAYNKTAQKYHELFKDELENKAFDKKIIDRYCALFDSGSHICDAGCGPSGHIANYISNKGFVVTGIDISEKCIEMASVNQPAIEFLNMDMMNTNFVDKNFNGIVSYYSIIYTPKDQIDRILTEFHRILKPDGKLLIVVKKGSTEGLIEDEWYEGEKVYFTYFHEREIESLFVRNNFKLNYILTRKPYDFEIKVDRIYAIATKISNT